MASYNKRMREEVKAFVAAHLELNPCVDCGEDDPVVLEFDHVRGKKRFNVGDAVRGRHSLDSIRMEIEKCDVRCANCHRRKTHRERQLST